MKVLHYTLGLPPYRTGGLTKYSTDLMHEQVRQHNEVFLLYPGHYSIGRKSKIIFNEINNNIKVYELVNPQLVPLLGGIKHPVIFQNKANKQIFLEFLINIKPDIIHIHSLMGLYVEFLQAAKILELKVVFTAHDYYGICPKVNLISFDYKPCTDYMMGEKCVMCNSRGFSNILMFFMQSYLYRKMKQSRILSILKKYRKKRIHTTREDSRMISSKFCEAAPYKNLRDYYLEILNTVDFFHFNSSVTLNIFDKYIKFKGRVINITHNDIKDKRIKKDYSNKNVLNISYLGSVERYKGYYLLLESLQLLINRGVINWVLKVYGNDLCIGFPDKDMNSKIIFNGKYRYEELKEIFYKTDLLIIPSICNETFGFIGLEALAHGVPVMLTENIGFTDIIENNETGIIVAPDASVISNEIEKIINDMQILDKINSNILLKDFNYSMDKHVIEIINLYKFVKEDFR